jgi:hypothetical protein
MWGRLEKIISNAKKLDESKAWKQVIDKEVKDEIIRLNTQDQLYEDGVDSLNKKLGDYSPYTVILKRLKGQKTSHITLKDTGAFYNSFKVQVNKDSITIIADDESKYDIPLTEDYGIDILGLTEDNKMYLFDWLQENYLKYVRKQLFR